MAAGKTSTRIVLISDVHGNLPALEAVLEDAARHGAEAVWNLGDVVGYAPFGNEVIDRLREIGAVNVVGNYDLKVLAFERKHSKWRKTKTPAKFDAFQYNSEHLSDNSRSFLESLPEQHRLVVRDVRVLLVHASPASPDELLGPDTPTQRLTELAASADADMVACGHSHKAFVRRVGGTHFVNPGSVGRPEGGDRRANYALVTFGPRGPDVDIRRVEYDVERVVRALEDKALDKRFASVFRQGRSLDQLAASNPSNCAPAGQSDTVFESVLALARRCDYEHKHTHQVARLALQLFDELTELHGMGEQERFYLHCGALLHDIGWVEGQQKHHKTAMRLILAEPGLLLDGGDRRIVALIARYHRKALPGPGHEVFADLNDRDRRRVRVLAGILRVADGLDRSHCSVVRGVRAHLTDRTIRLLCRTSRPMEIEIEAAVKKSDLLSNVLKRQLIVERAIPRS